MYEDIRLLLTLYRKQFHLLTGSNLHYTEPTPTTNPRLCFFAQFRHTIVRNRSLTVGSPYMHWLRKLKRRIAKLKLKRAFQVGKDLESSIVSHEWEPIGPITRAQESAYRRGKRAGKLSQPGKG